jgi:hypothetical protein
MLPILAAAMDFVVSSAALAAGYAGVPVVDIVADFAT